MPEDITDSISVEDDPRRGPHAARFNFSVAKSAFCKLEHVSFAEQKLDWFLYFSSTITFGRAALDALRGSSHRKRSGGADGSQNSIIAEEWDKLFVGEVKSHPLFTEILAGERDILSHGQNGAAIHPHWPIDTVFRHDDLEVIFGEGPPTWPDGTFKGMTVDDVLNRMLIQVGKWIDDVDARRDMRSRQSLSGAS